MQVVILAGGAGRRFGGAKQFVPVAPDGATLLEVTARDAHCAGCRKAVVVTAPGREDDVRKLFAARPVPGLELVVVPQRPDDLPVAVGRERARPWGTAHALWAARGVADEPFLVFNADDSYGSGAPAALAATLAEFKGKATFALLAYPLGETLSPAGTVARAVCETDGRGRLLALREHPAIDPNGRIVGGDEDGRPLPPETLVSMNAWAFTPAVFPLLEMHLREFLSDADRADTECYLPAAVDAAVRAGRAVVLVRPAADRWCGLTWPDDRERVAHRLAAAASARAAAAFGLAVPAAAPAAFGAGLVNTTWRVEATRGAVLLQLLNREVFPDPVAIAENAAAAAVRIDDALRRRGDDDPRHRLVFLAGPGGRPWFRDDDGAVWRAAQLVPDARPADPRHPEEIRAAAAALGRFPGLVAAGAGPPLRETLPGFHDTPARFAACRAAAGSDAHGRLAGCRAEYQRLVALVALARRLAAGNLPRRVVHNDAKLDNVLVDGATGAALCVVDLDTAMPGVCPHDFGDLVRSAVTGRPEDEPDPARIAVRTEVFAALAAGYLEGAADWITAGERDRLVDGALVIAYEQALRFLADHLAGDVYYRIDETGHNLRRARAQLALLEGLLAHEPELRRIIAGC